MLLCTSSYFAIAYVAGGGVECSLFLSVPLWSHPGYSASHQDRLHMWMWFPYNARSACLFPGSEVRKVTLWLWPCTPIACWCSHRPIAHVCVLSVCLFVHLWSLFGRVFPCVKHLGAWCVSYLPASALEQPWLCVSKLSVCLNFHWYLAPISSSRLSVEPILPPSIYFSIAFSAVLLDMQFQSVALYLCD